MRLKAILFDLDGTLVDSNDLHVEAWREAFRIAGFNVTHARIQREIGKGGDLLVPAVLGADLERAHGDAIRKSRDEVFGGIMKDATVRFLPGALAAMALCRKHGYRTAIATSSSPEDVERMNKATGVKLADLVDAMTNADDVGTSKPAPDIVTVACKKLGVATRDSVLIGDSVFDGVAADRAGAAFVGVRTGYPGQTALLCTGARFVLPNLHSLVLELDTCIGELTSKRSSFHRRAG
jgi:phosphoglycolate phosphatase-like HAD superfamily hydrolase